MRLPLVPEIDSRDGTSNKDERLTNALSETDEGVTLAVVRPGLVFEAEGTGVGGGLVAYNLAVEIAPEYQLLVPPTVIGIAVESKANIKRVNIRPSLAIPDLHGLMGTGKSDIYAGGYV